MILAVIFFCIDMLTHSFFSMPYSTLLWNLYSIAVFSLPPLMCLGIFILLMLQGIAQHSMILPTLIGSTIIYLLGSYGRSIINPASTVPYFFTLIISLALVHILHTFFNHIPFPSCGFTLCFLSGNILLNIIFLKFFFQGRLDSR